MNKQSIKSYDVIIIGGGVAGLSAALWCDELGLSAIILEEKSELGGQLLWVYNEIKNYLGIEARNGRELRDAFLEQTAKRRFDLRLKAQISDVDLEKKRLVLAGGEIFAGRAVIIATGIRRRRLGVAGEDDFVGRGIIDSGKKNAAFVAGKRAAIIGGGDAAFENALILAETAAHVALLHRRRDFRARPEFIAAVQKNPKVKIYTETAVRKIAGGERIESLEIENLSSGETEILPVEALLIRIGVAPNTEIFRRQLKLNDAGYIEVDRDCQTSAADVFAAGDVANPLAPTISTAAGMGATAAKAIFSLLNY